METKKKPRDRRKKSLRKRETQRGVFIRYRAREIFDAPVTYEGREFTEVHIVANLGSYVLTLKNGDLSAPGPRSIGLRGDYGTCGAVAERTVANVVESLVTQAKSGTLVGPFENHAFTGCLY